MNAFLKRVESFERRHPIHFFAIMLIFSIIIVASFLGAVGGFLYHAGKALGLWP